MATPDIINFKMLFEDKMAGLEGKFVKVSPFRLAVGVKVGKFKEDICMLKNCEGSVNTMES